MNSQDFAKAILQVLESNPGVTARELASELSVERRAINQYLHENDGRTVKRDDRYRWYKASPENLREGAPAGDGRIADGAPRIVASPAPQRDIRDHPGPDILIQDVLESLRKRLLDLTSRNRLLHFRHPKTGSIRVIDELPDQLKRHLVDDEKEMRFIPVPDPTRPELIEAGHIEIDNETGAEQVVHTPDAREWAKWLGLDTSYESPSAEQGDQESKHADNAIQTMLFPDELESRLRSMYQKTRSAIEETGANILYLALGFLEWDEQRDAIAKRLAPLYMIPVRIERGRLNPATRTYEYRLNYSGEDMLTNMSLREKLRNDFQIALPELADDVDPEAYIEAVADAVCTREPAWLTRRYVTLCHLNFSKQLLYLDLDPDNWPTPDALIGHPLVQQCLAGLREEDSDTNFGEEYSIDDIKSIHEEYPLIDDADSSQHSALIDAIDGNNLVIEGPPGTGKSQTITNLIAAAIANKKKVLFVAEKAAALEVVKRRLDHAGLGDFCLELHSHRSQKRRVLDDLAARLKLQGRLKDPAGIDSAIEHFESLKTSLRRHARLLNTCWKDTGLTIHDLLSAAVRYRQELSVDPGSLHPDSISGETFSEAERNRILGHARTFATQYKGVMGQLGSLDNIHDHPWCGIRDTSLQAFEQEHVVEILTEWQKSLEELVTKVDAFGDTFHAGTKEVPRDLGGLRQLVDAVCGLPTFDGTEPFYVIQELEGANALAFADGIRLYDRIQQLYEDLANQIVQERLKEPNSVETLIHSTEWLSSCGTPNLKLVEIRGDVELVDALVESVGALEEPIRQTSEGQDLSGVNAFSVTLFGIGGFVRLCELVASLPPQYLGHRDSCFDQDEIDSILPSLTEELESLRSRAAELQKIFDFRSTPGLERLKEIEQAYRNANALGWLRKEWRSARKDLKASRAKKNVRLEILKENLPELVSYTGAKKRFEANRDYVRLLGQQFEGLGTDIERIAGLRRWYQEVREEYGIGFGRRVPIGDRLLGISSGLATALRSLWKRGLKDELGRVQEAMKSLSTHYPGVRGLDDRGLILSGDRSPLSELHRNLPRIFSHVENGFQADDLRISEANDLAQRLKSLLRYLGQWQELRLSERFCAGRVSLTTGVGQTDTRKLECLRRIAAVGDLLTKPLVPRAICAKLYGEPSRGSIDLLMEWGHQLSGALSKEEAVFRTFKEKVDLDASAWLHGGGESFDALRARNGKALSNSQWLPSWLAYLRARAQFEQNGWKKVVAAVEGKSIEAENIEAAVLLGATDLLCRQALREVPELSTFSGLTQEGIREQFQEYDDRLRELQRKKIAWEANRIRPPHGNSAGLVRNYTELSLVKHEINKKKRHIPLRQLLKRAGQAISDLKPCFMMGPMSVAQYLAPGEMNFDLVVMDEASQVRPEDALGSLARGRQLIVVGDPKQLPPTSFFDKLLDEEDEEDEHTAAQQSESILDAALTTFPARRLRWHYRSQHESLIAFSNHAYYDSDLIIFPSPVNEAPEYGVQFTRVRRGRFINRVNREEAELVAKAVRQHMLMKPDESIGVVAMSAQQREQIERSIEQETKEDAHFRNLVEQDKENVEPLFVKNLENVQGDERDVIYISMTYGPSEVGGRVAQRFGPINSINGWRRLNVLFTRAKKRMHAFSSMGRGDIIVSNTSSRGVQSLKAFLEYAETGHLTSTVEHTGRPPDSDFEVAVARALSDYGFECQPQVGVAGYFLDIAVRDPGSPGRYLMAIECDGATYHSAKSTRDRDRLRQRILERLGWRVRRIWSTDWYNNPDGQLGPIIDELNRLKTAPRLDEQATYDEVEEIEEIGDEIEQEVAFASTIVESEADLRQALEKFDREIVREKYPDTVRERRLLRPSMMEALLACRPTTVWEFHQKIPPYLRQGTEPKEGEFIKAVLEIIYASDG